MAIRADADRLATSSELIVVSREHDEGSIGGRVIDAFERFAAVDDAGGYTSRDYALREPTHGMNGAVAKVDPRFWTPAAPSSLVAYDLPRQ